MYSFANAVKTSFEMKDGRVLSCNYVYAYTPASWFDPEEGEIMDEVFFIDEEEIEYDKLPKGLSFIADQFFQAGPGQFNYSSEPIREDYNDYEYDL